MSQEPVDTSAFRKQLYLADELKSPLEDARRSYVGMERPTPRPRMGLAAVH